MKRAIVYCRVSSKKQEDNSSLGTQESVGKKWCKENGYKVERVTKEVFTGAEFFERPKLCLDRAEIRAGKVDALVIDCIDRLGRDIAGLAIVLEECKKANCELVFVNEPLDTSPEGKLITSVRSYTSEIERIKIRERTMRGRRAKILQGRPVMLGSPLYGYIADRDNERYLVNEDEARIVEKIFKLALNGYGGRTIARKLNQQNLLSQTGIPWTASTVHKMLKRSEYKGESYANRFIITEDKRTRIRKRSDWVKLNEGTHPAIVDESTFDAVQEIISQHNKMTARNDKSFVILRGMVFCKICSSPMHTFYTTDNGRAPRIRFRCGKRYDTVNPCLRSVTISERRLTPIVWNAVKPFIEDPKELDRVIAASLKENNPERIAKEVAVIEGKMAKIDRGIARLLTTFRNSDESLLRHIENQINDATREKERLQMSLLSLKEQTKQEQRTESIISHIRTGAHRLSAYIHEVPDKEKRQFLLDIGTRIYIGESKPEIHINPFSF